jgi:hypothetical protein
LEDLQSPVGFRFERGVFYSLKAPDDLTPPIRTYLKELHKRTGDISMPIVWNHLTSMDIDIAEINTYLVLFVEGFIKYTKLEAVKL